MEDFKKNLLLLHKLYASLYGEGLVGVSETYIQITTECFKKIVVTHDNLTCIHRNNGEIELCYIEDGVAFITLI